MNDKRDFDRFLACLIEAGTKIDSLYFKLPVVFAEKPIFRERVYCYELYHQLRCILGDDFPYALNGEVDKASHHILKGAEKPDFIVHTPGNMNNNLAVIEVKPIRARPSEIKKDIEKLQKFLRYKYYRAIMLLYGDNCSAVENIQCHIDNLLKEHAEHIILIWHKKPKEKPRVVLNV